MGSIRNMVLEQDQGNDKGVWQMLYDIIVILWLHFAADFILQTDYVACNKSKNNKILALHAAIYTVPLVLYGVS